ncbi:hypothetical protein SO802_019108 [Lithocarpus litseifolius]|uniref:Phytosulfokine n=1 Tax=Lithocarpus litseifolius TaxID=425828 RepID=A0AAW2CR58_9ROSI
MKQGFHSSALILALLLLLLSCSKLSSRSIANKQGQVEVKLNEIASGDSFADLEGSESMNVCSFFFFFFFFFYCMFELCLTHWLCTLQQLMGMENCNEGDEECLERRVLSEVHLDYIYTQHHKP